MNLSGTTTIAFHTVLGAAPPQRYAAWSRQPHGIPIRRRVRSRGGGAGLPLRRLAGLARSGAWPSTDRPGDLHVCHREVLADLDGDGRSIGTDQVRLVH